MPDGTLACSRTGAGLALVAFEEALISIERTRSSRSGQLWVVADAQRVPPVDTRVELILGPTRSEPLRLVLDRRGVLWMDGCRAEPDDLAAWAGTSGPDEGSALARVEVQGSLESDVGRLRAKLDALGCLGVTFVRGRDDAH